MARKQKMTFAEAQLFQKTGLKPPWMLKDPTKDLEGPLTEEQELAGIKHEIKVKRWWKAKWKKEGYVNTSDLSLIHI